MSALEGRAAGMPAARTGGAANMPAGVADSAERRELVELLAALSPRSLPVRPPALGGRLAPLLRAPLPRQPLAFLFDVYGTLVASAAGGDPLSGLGRAGGARSAAVAALEAELAELGLNGGVEGFAREAAELIAAANEARRPSCPHPEVDIEAVLGRGFPAVAGARARRLAVLLEASLNPCAPMIGAAGLLGRLRLDGRPAGLVSNAQFYTPLLLEAQFGPAAGPELFAPELSFFSYELGVAKPDTAAFELAAEGLARRGIGVDRAVYLGNSFDTDVAPARRVGLMTVLFAGDERSFRPPAGEDFEGPDSLVASLADFAELAGLA